MIRVSMDLPNVSTERPKVHWGFLRQFGALKKASEEIEKFIENSDGDDDGGMAAMAVAIANMLFSVVVLGGTCYFGCCLSQNSILI